MKEHFQDYGIRKWAGNDLIELQSEPMEALQKLVEPYAPCILQGCEVTENEGGYITVKPGLVALQGKDCKGEDCVKIARFAGVADKTPPVYLTLECEPESRVYGDSQSKAIAYNYIAVATAQKPETSYLEINADCNRRLVDTLGITQKLDREGGDASNVKVAFNNEGTDAEDLKSDNTLAKLFGAIKKWLSDIKKKLDGIENGANKYTHPTHNSIIGSTGSMAPGFGGKAYTHTYDIDDKGHVTKQISRTITIPNTAASQSSAGLMSASDKKKLDNITEGANKTTVDTSFDASSENPVQNNVVKKALDDKLSLSGGTITGNLRLKGSGNYGNKLNFGDSEYVYLHEETDDALTIKANEIKLNAATGGVNVTAGQLKENGARVYSPNNKPTLADIGAASSSHSHSSATTSTAGFMSSSDKTKLDTCVRLHYLGYSDKEGNVTKIGGLSSMNITVSKMTTTGLYYLYNIGNNNKDVVVIINSTESNIFAKLSRILHNGSARIYLENTSGDGVFSPFMIMVMGI